ncbi:MAG: rod shape-determining protein MreD [Anaerolineales bacterium]|nr:rod shape-determining protein MreD [Anaerolineales bacterium]
MWSTILLAIPFMLFLTVLQTAVLPRFPIFGIVPQLPFLLAVAWGLLRGPNEGALWGFMAGLTMDLFTIAPTGGLALTYTISVAVVSFIINALPTNRIVMPMLMAAMGTLIQQILYYLFLQLFGYSLSVTVVASLLPSILLNAFLILPFYWAMYVINRTLWPKPVEL